MNLASSLISTNLLSTEIDNIPAGQSSCSVGYPIVVSPTATSGDYNVSVTYSWSG